MANDKLIRASDARRAILKAEPRLAYIIDNIPAVDAAPVVHGRWIWKDFWHDGSFVLCCSECLETEGARENANYCPHCGAKMDGGAEDGKC